MAEYGLHPNTSKYAICCGKGEEEVIRKLEEDAEGSYSDLFYFLYFKICVLMFLLCP